MGEVYRARDTRLARDVAIKILPSEVVHDTDRTARFQREAQILAALDHPHIARIYGLEVDQGIQFLVLELIEGETLAGRTARGPIPIDEALALAGQIADALQAAHDKGITHRDLKPANIAVSIDGQVKVLDFGLAKLDARNDSSGDAGALVSQSPTISLAATHAGVILGTAAYMSPEQAKGRVVDKRTDVWAFGCVLYEMLTGRRAFGGEDLTETIAAVVRGEPDWTALPANLPPRIRLLLQRCLDKDRRTRIADIAVARFVLDDTQSAPLGWSTVAASRLRLAVERVAALAAGVIVSGAIAWALWPGAQAPRPSRFAVVLPPAAALAVQGADRDIAVAQDGARIVYRGSPDNAQLMVRSLDQLDARPLTGTTGGRNPFLSPDGSWVGFFVGNELRKVAIAGGSATSLARNQTGPRGAAWGPDSIVFATADARTGLMIVPAGGGEPRELTKPDAKANEEDHLFPSWLPGGRAILFTITSTSRRLEDARVAVLDLQTGQRKVLVSGTSAEYVESGHLVYASAGALRAVRFDPERLEVLSDPVPVVDQIVTSLTGAANFAVSRTGTLVFVPGDRNLRSALRTVVWVDRQGKEESLGAPVRAYQHVSLSPDGTRVALSTTDQDLDIWVWDLARSVLTRLTFGRGPERFPVWTPDGRFIAFATSGEGSPGVQIQAADGTGTPHQVTVSATQPVPSAISPDGTKMVLFDVMGQQADLGFIALSPGLPTPTVKAGSTIAPLVKTPFNEFSAAISPDGRWMAYNSNESGQPEIYVRPFPNVNEGKWQVSSGGGVKPVWARSGRELFFLDTANALEAVTVATGAVFRAGSPSKLFEGKYYAPQFERGYDVSPDGRRFLMIKEAAASEATPASLVVALNWSEELKRLLPEK